MERCQPDWGKLSSAATRNGDLCPCLQARSIDLAEARRRHSVSGAGPTARRTWHLTEYSLLTLPRPARYMGLLEWATRREQSLSTELPIEDTENITVFMAALRCS